MINPSYEVLIWGTGREGKAAAAFFLARHPDLSLAFLDEASKEIAPESLRIENKNIPVISAPSSLEDLVIQAGLLVKSPGVSLYHPLLEKRKALGLPITSLLNLWLAERRDAVTIAITGTKGKSTTASLMGHVLNSLGQKTAVLGNIGTPVTEAPKDAEIFVIEVSSYQAANLSESVSIAILTSLYPEHLDWHKSLHAYYRDKSHLLAQGRQSLVSSQAHDVMAQNGLSTEAPCFGCPEGWHFEGPLLYKGAQSFGTLDNAYLCRAHNKTNALAVIAALDLMGYAPKETLAAMSSYKGLPHREQEMGEKDGILYVDDSISTTPHSAMAALEAFSNHPAILLAGGYDRGVPYDALADYVRAHATKAVICMGASGPRLFEQLQKKGYQAAHLVNTMEEAVHAAKARAEAGDVILLSPGAPSYDHYKDFTERAVHFASLCGFQVNDASS